MGYCIKVLEKKIETTTTLGLKASAIKRGFFATAAHGQRRRAEAPTQKQDFKVQGVGFRATCCRMVPEEVRSGNDSGGKLLS